MAAVNRGCVLAAVAVFCFTVAGCSDSESPGWTACQSNPTPSCILEEALYGRKGALEGKERLDVLLQLDVLSHPEYATAADIKEAQRLAKEEPHPFAAHYLYFAVYGLVAAHQWQDAFDLVASSNPEMHDVAFGELTRALVKAGEQGRVKDLLTRMPPPSPDPNNLIPVFAKALTEAGKIDAAVALIGEVQSKVKINEYNMAQALIAVAQAYAERGDAKLADQFFDKARASLLTGLQRGLESFQLGVQIAFRFNLIALLALRGDMEAVKTALQELPPPVPDGVDPVMRKAGYQRVVLALLQVKQFALALEVAKSIPESAANERDSTLARVAIAKAADGQIDDARALLSSFDNKTEPKIRASLVRGLAVALARAGDVSSALQTAAQIDDRTSRKVALFLIAQTLP